MLAPVLTGDSMKYSAIVILAGAMLATPAFAQDWGQDYNQGIIGVLGGTEAGGTISLNCADAGNGVVKQGELSIFLNPGTSSAIGDASPGELSFDVDGTVVVLPVTDNQGDGFVYDKTPETLDQATDLVDLLETGKVLVVSAAGEDIATIDLAGAGEALDGVDVCLAP
jgi:hypothetical protein